MSLLSRCVCVCLIFTKGANCQLSELTIPQSLGSQGRNNEGIICSQWREVSIWQYIFKMSNQCILYGLCPIPQYNLSLGPKHKWSLETQTNAISLFFQYCIEYVDSQSIILLEWSTTSWKIPFLVSSLWMCGVKYSSKWEKNKQDYI